MSKSLARVQDWPFLNKCLFLERINLKRTKHKLAATIPTYYIFKNTFLFAENALLKQILCGIDSNDPRRISLQVLNAIIIT